MTTASNGGWTPPPRTIRDYCRNREPLDGSDAQALEGALSQVERELAAMTDERNTLKAAVDVFGDRLYAATAESEKLRGALEEAVNRLSMPRYQREKGGT